MNKHDKWLGDAKVDEFDVLGSDAYTEEDYIDNDERAPSVGGTGEEFRYIDPESLLSPDSVVDGKELYSATTYAEYRQYLDMVYSTPYSKLEISYDIETNAESPLSEDFKIIGFSISDTTSRGIYCIKESLDLKVPDEEWDLIVRDTKELFDRADEITVHNIGYELPSTVNEWDYFIPEHKAHDTMIMLRVTFPKEPAGLKPASARYLGYADWDAELSVYNKAVKDLIGKVHWIRNSRGARNKSSDFELMINDQVFDREQHIHDIQYLKNLMENPPEPSELSSNIVMVLQVLESNEILSMSMWELVKTSILDIVDEGGLRTNVIPFSLIPSKIISKYGALDSIATSELKEYVLEQMESISSDIRRSADEISGIFGRSKFNLYSGYRVVLQQYYAGQYLEMAGAHWDDKVAQEERDWYNDTAIESWRSLVTNPRFEKEFLDINRINMAKRMFRDAMREIYDAGLGNSEDTAKMSSDEVSEKVNSLSTMGLSTYQFINTIGVESGQFYGNYTMQKTQIKFWGWLDETDSGDLEVKVIRYNRFFEEMEDYLSSDYLDDIIMTELYDGINGVTQYEDLKPYYNPSSTTRESYDRIDRALNTQDLKLARLYDTLHQWTTNPREYDPYWLYVTPEGETKIIPGYEPTHELYEHIKVGFEDEKGDLIRDTYPKFVELLTKASESGYDKRLMEDISKSQEYVFENLSEPMMIDIYRYYQILGFDADDDPSTWSDEFRLLYDFRVYKKCIKMISSYIDGRVGRRSVQLANPDDKSDMLPLRKGAYFDGDWEGGGYGDRDDIMTLMTSRFLVGMADTGRWRAAIHTVPSGSSIKNIYTSRYKGGVIASPDYCLTPETRIKLLDGTSPTVKELYEEYGVDGEYWVYSYDKGSGEVRPGKARHTRITKEVDEVYKIHMNDCTSVEVTDNHPFLLRSGKYVRADELSVGDSLMSMYWKNDSDILIEPGRGKEIAHGMYVSSKGTYDRHCKLLNLTYMEYGILNGVTFSKTMKSLNYKRVIRFDTLVEKYGIDKIYEMATTYDHKVVKIEVVSRETEVYDLEVDNYHNFLIDLGNKSGVFVHNSQLEVRVLGASAEEENILQAFRDGADIHTMIAKSVWNKPEVSESERRFSKMVTFAILYGADAGNIARNFMQGDIERATSLVNNFYAGYPKIRDWIDMKHEEWKRLGYVTLMTDRIIKIPVPDQDDPKYFSKMSSALRQSQNYPIQGSGSDIGGVALYRSCDYIHRNNLKSRAFSYVHDALYFDIHPHEIFDIYEVILREMNDYPVETYDMPVKADMVLGPSMGQELEVEEFMRTSENSGYFVFSGLEDDFNEMVEHWDDIYKEVIIEDIEEPVGIYVPRGELFVPKRAIPRYAGMTRYKVVKKVTITVK